MTVKIIRHQRVAALDQGQCALAFTDAGIAAEHHPDALDVEGGGVFGAGGGELVIISASVAILIQFIVMIGVRMDRQSEPLTHFQHRRRRDIVARQHQAGDAAAAPSVR
jgi:hypothetical protein